MFRGEAHHLRAFLGYVRSSHLTNAITHHDWAKFARGYNGPRYILTHYDQHMAAAYAAIHASRVRHRLRP